MSVLEFTEWRELLTKVPISGRCFYWERSSLLSWFRTSFFWEVPRALRDCTRSFEFRRNSSSFNQARRIRLSEQLNSWARFLLTLPSMFLETCVICSSLIVETFVLRDKLFLGCFFWLSLDCRYFPFVSKSNHLNASFKTEFTLLAYLPGEPRHPS